MELITEEILFETEEYWNLHSRSLYHELISAIISQRISFNESRHIRSKLYNTIQSGEITFDHIQELGYDGLINLGIDSKKACTILTIPDEINIDELIHISGIGKWTIKALKIKCSDEDVFLSEDYWIRKHMKIILNLKHIPTIKEVDEYIESNVLYDRSIYTKFLWRLKHTAWDKIKNGKLLTRTDFV